MFLPVSVFPRMGLPENRATPLGTGQTRCLRAATSVLAAEEATVRLIDCHSFQVIANGRRFACEVGVETFTLAELQGFGLRRAR